MNEEIKEILDKLKEETALKPLWYSERIKLLNYITNLQNRITELEEINKQHQELNGVLNQRINKAIKYIEVPVFDGKNKEPVDVLIDLLNILQDKEEV